MKHLNGLKIKTILAERGLCHTVKLEDTIPQPVVFEVFVYVGSHNAYEWEIWLNKLKVHSGTSYLDLHQTFIYADKVIDYIIEEQLKGISDKQGDR